MDSLKYRNSFYAILYVANFVSACVICACVFGTLMTYFFEDARDFTLVFIIGLTIIAFIWLSACLAIILSKTVIVTSTDITMCRGTKVKWRVKKEDIKECIYNRIKWYYFLFPIATINAYALQVRIADGKIAKRSCSLSFKQINQIKHTFDYPIRIINSIAEQ